MPVIDKKRGRPLDYDSPPAIVMPPPENEPGRFTFPVLVPKVPRCPKHEADEIVVCAQDPETFRLRPLPDKFGDPDTVPRARMNLGEKTSIGAELERAGVGGQVSNRVMVRGKIKF